MKRDTLTLRKPPDPVKIALSLQIGMRYVDRKGRYTQQVQLFLEAKQEHTWVDIPLVPETYGEALA